LIAATLPVLAGATAPAPIHPGLDSHGQPAQPQSPHLPGTGSNARGRARKRHGMAQGRKAGIDTQEGGMAQTTGTRGKKGWRIETAPGVGWELTTDLDPGDPVRRDTFRAYGGAVIEGKNGEIPRELARHLVMRPDWRFG